MVPLHDCPDLRREMSEAAYQRASLLFRAERMARDMERNYEELLYGDDQERQQNS